MFTSAQINAVTPVSKRQPAPVEYNSAHDAEIAGMQGRRWEELEVFNPEAKRIYHLLSSCWLLGNAPDFEDVPFIMSIARLTQNERVRKNAVCALKNYICDCSGTDQTLRPAAVELVTNLGFDPYYRRKT